MTLLFEHGPDIRRHCPTWKPFLTVVPRMTLPLSLPVRLPPLRSRNSATRLATLTPGRNSGPDRLVPITIPSRGAQQVSKMSGTTSCVSSGIGGDLHRLGVCGRLIVGYNVAIGGDEEAGTFADHHTLRLLAFGKKNLKKHQIAGWPGAPIVENRPFPS